MSYLVRALALVAFLASGQAWAACNPAAATTGMVGCLPVLTSPQTTDTLMLWRPSLFPNSLNQITLANFLGSLPAGMPLSALGGGYTNGQLLIGGTASGNLAANTLTAGSGISITNGTNAITIALTNLSTTVNGQTCTLGSTCTVTASSGTITVGTTTVASGTTTKVLFDNAGVLGEYTVSGTGNVALTTSPTLITPALGTPSALVLTNATGLPCGAMPALTGAVTSSSGSCATTAATQTNEKCVTWDSTTAVTAQTIDFPVEWTSFTLTSVKAKVGGGGSFTFAMQIGGTPVTSCNGVTVNSSSNVATSCTGANTGSANAIISMVIASPSGTVNQAYVCPVFTHTVN